MSGGGVQLFVAGVEGVQGMDSTFVSNLDATHIVGTTHSAYHTQLAELLAFAGAFAATGGLGRGCRRERWS